MQDEEGRWHGRVANVEHLRPGDDMQRREDYLYVGMDLHKDTHTAVMVNCWNEKLDVIVIENKPSKFNKLAKRVNKKATALGLSPIYGL